MKGIATTLVFIALFATTALTQNLQVHYDFGKAKDGDVNKDRGYFTTTLEMYKPDTLGYTFFFVDMDYNGENGISFSYWEILRGFNIPRVNFLKLEVSYNGGVGYVNNAWLVGPAVPMKIGDSYITLSAYYRIEKFQKSANAQVTAVWTVPVLEGKIKFMGFFDVWSRDNFIEGKGKMITLLTEPQLWYNLNNHFALGSEVELSYNFFTFDKDIEAMPTAAVKWTF
ncbi:DUF5020 family protein [Chryseolinea sp. T2]|uniref:DUF5020 family protein n=1 Tax=Chryseolinea sp. T2 TaxID=3129255 RepID=UPI0030780137